MTDMNIEEQVALARNSGDALLTIKTLRRLIEHGCDKNVLRELAEPLINELELHVAKGPKKAAKKAAKKK